MNIGKAAENSGVSAKMIRYYESIKLIPKANRTDSGYRDYSQKDVHRLLFISRARNLGFSVEKIGGLLELWQNKTRSSADVKRIALEHVAELEEKVCELKAMSNTISHLANHCQGDHRPDCPIIDGLSTFPSQQESVQHRPNKFGLLGNKHNSISKK